MADRMCAACGEVKHLVGRGMCSPCWQRARRAGTLAQFGRVRLNFAELYALAQANETPSGCWPWPSVNTTTGYGLAAKIDGRPVGPHRAVWLRINGPIPDGMTIDHRCHTDDPTCPGGNSDPHRRCVRPDHLQLASHAQQQRWQHKKRAPHCGNGHPRNEANVRVDIRVSKNGKTYQIRICRVCHRENARQRRTRC